ncbi:hypothetical protein PLESTB_000726400 [Pleodorina starrii]|uniref:Wax synthase domain-containing protein n=1 Tax=Pleodorina starrii TaxID=330485 RepID=A0A9W6BJD7_9CHLO|nr:hypothetical protein PLESTB_000726400 [Pleodorina starrii]GLC67261.1 hypothetical protein PLESTF_000534600 [Pleodorina starrii]
MNPPFWDTGIPSSWRLLGVGLAYVLVAFWIKYVVARLPLGAARVISSLPVFAVSIVCPWVFDARTEVLQRLSAVFIYSWLCNFKVLAFCWGRPPLRESMTVVQIAAVTMLPIFLRPPESIASGPKGRLQDSAGSAVALALRWLAKIVLLGSIAFLVIGYGDSMPGAVRHYVYSFGLYAFVGFLMDGPAALAVEALGLQVIPTFDQPWMSSCLADFWGRRWNIPTTSVLRTVVYDTIVDGCLVIPARRLAAAPATAAAELKNLPRSAQNGGDHQTHLAPASPPEHQQMQRSPRTPAEQELAARSHPQPKQQQQPMQQGARRPSMLRRQLGLHATFLVSGLVHDYIAWLVRLDGVWGWKWTVFFYMQAPLMSLEALGNRLLRRAGVQLPRPLTILLTLAALEVMAYDLFFGFVERDTDLAHRVVTAVTSSYAGLLAPLQPLVAGLVAAASEVRQ